MSHLYEEKLNNQGCLMKIIECKNKTNIVVEFQDEYKAKVSTQYINFQRGIVKNPYYPSVLGIGIIGTKYPRSINCKELKEYESWKCILRRCYDGKTKNSQPTYCEVTCCKEWLNYENFYEWLHSQDNFGKWHDGKRWAVDKDILVKGNKVYSPDTYCLVPQGVNCLFLKRDAARGKYPIGVRYECGRFKAICQNSIIGKTEELGKYSTAEEAFNVYKKYKEDIIKQVAQKEYKAGNITKRCYEAMVNYKVEIND